MTDKERAYRKTDKVKKLRYKSKLKNYSLTAKYQRTSFTDKEDEMILAHYITDRELSKKIRHSVESIQIRRARLRKKYRALNE